MEITGEQLDEFRKDFAKQWCNCRISMMLRFHLEQ